MAITIDPEGADRYRIKLTGDRDRIFAQSPEEAATAVLHHFIRPHDEANCPLCRLIDERGHRRTLKE